MIETPIIRELVAGYPHRWVIRACESLGSSGGFSGARFWRLETDQGSLCVRQWPAQHPSAEQLRFIHQVLEAAHARQIDYVPVPYRSLEQSTFVRHAGTLWEITNWLPGAADFQLRPTAARLQSAMDALARFHLAVAGVHDRRGPSPGIRQRLEQLRDFMGTRAVALDPPLARLDWAEFRRRGQRLLALARAQAADVEQLVAASAGLLVPLQPVIRDIWHDHVLFQDDRVTGIVDFGATRCDSVATDLARLVGSLVRDDSDARRQALECYARLRPLSSEERTLVVAFDRSTVLLSGLNWIRWIACEGRRFEHEAAVLRRLDEWLERLDAK